MAEEGSWTDVSIRPQEIQLTSASTSALAFALALCMNSHGKWNYGVEKHLQGSWDSEPRP